MRKSRRAGSFPYVSDARALERDILALVASHEAGTFSADLLFWFLSGTHPRYLKKWESHPLLGSHKAIPEKILPVVRSLIKSGKLEEIPRAEMPGVINPRLRLVGNRPAEPHKDIPLELLPGISFSTFGYLKRARILTINQLAEMSPEELLKIRGVGKGTLQKILHNLKTIFPNSPAGKRPATETITNDAEPVQKDSLKSERELMRPPEEQERPAFGTSDQTREPHPGRNYLTLPIEMALHDCGNRVRNSLRIIGVRTIAELVQQKEHHLLALRNFGRKSLSQIKDYLTGHSLRLGMTAAEVDAIIHNSPEPSPAPIISEDVPPDATIEIPFEINREPHPGRAFLTLPVETVYEFSNRVRRLLKEIKVHTIAQLVQKDPVKLLAVPHFGRQCLSNIDHILTEHSLRLGMSSAEVDDIIRNSPAPTALVTPASKEVSSGAEIKTAPTGNIVVSFQRYLAELNDRDRRLIAHRYQSARKQTLESTGRSFRLTRERVRQLIARNCAGFQVRMRREGFQNISDSLQRLNGICDLTEENIPFLCVSKEALTPLVALINAVAAESPDSSGVFFDDNYCLWHLGETSISDRLYSLRETLSGLVTPDEVLVAIRRKLKISSDRDKLIAAITEHYISHEMTNLPGTNWVFHQSITKTQLLEEILKLKFPKGTHFSTLSKATSSLGASNRVAARNVHAQMYLNPNILLWGRGIFRHKDSTKIDQQLLAEVIEKIDEMFLPGINTVSAAAIFGRYRSLVVQAGLDTPHALYASLEWLFPDRFLYRHFPDIESLSASKQPKLRRNQEFESILADADGPLSIEQIITRMGSHRQVKEYQIAQRLPESRCVLLYDSGCFVHEDVLGITEEIKASVQAQATAFLQAGPGYATVKQVRLSINLPLLKLPWTLRLLGAVLEQTGSLSRAYNVVCVGTLKTWDEILDRIVIDIIGDRPGITMNDLNGVLISQDFITLPLTPKAIEKLPSLRIADGYIQRRAL